MSEIKTGNEVRLTICLGEEDRKMLQDAYATAVNCEALLTMLLEKLSGGTPVVKEEVKVEEPKKAMTLEFKPAEEAIPAEFKEEPVAEPTITIDDLRTKVIQVVNSGKKAEAKAIIAEYAPSVTKVPADKVAEAYKRISALEG